MKVIASVPDHLKGEELMRFLKLQDFSINDPYLIPIKESPDIHLRLVSTVNPNEVDVERLSTWRNRYVTSFLTEFEATSFRTKNWLIQNVGKDLSRILFMIEENGHPPLGYIGLAFIDFQKQVAEADLVVRGEQNHPGIMSEALKALIEWARMYLGLKHFGVHVLSDNPAVAFYQNFGFIEVNKTPLKREETDGFVAWKVIAESSNEIVNQRWLIYMELR